jgi:hypothetical protein
MPLGCGITQRHDLSVRAACLLGVALAEDVLTAGNENTSNLWIGGA